VALLKICEVFKVVGLMSGGIPGEIVGGAGQAVDEGGETAASGCFFCSSSFAHFLSRRLKQSTTSLSSVATASVTDSSSLQNLKSTASLKHTSRLRLLSTESLKSFSSFKTILLRYETSARSNLHSHLCKTCSSLKPDDVLKEAAFTELFIIF